MLGIVIRLALAACVISWAILSAACFRDPGLDAIAELRVTQLVATDQLDHTGFLAAIKSRPGWHAEVLASSDEPLTLAIALEMWGNSPPHREALEHGATSWGFATGRSLRTYYAVMLLEDTRCLGTLSHRPPKIIPPAKSGRGTVAAAVQEC